jgi:hypothetical protein
VIFDDLYGRVCEAETAAWQSWRDHGQPITVTSKSGFVRVHPALTTYMRLARLAARLEAHRARQSPSRRSGRPLGAVSAADRAASLVTPIRPDASDPNGERSE